MLEPLPWFFIVMKDAGCCDQIIFKTWSQPPKYVPLQYTGVPIISTQFAGRMMVWDYSYQVKANHKDLLKVGQVTR